MTEVVGSDTFVVPSAWKRFVLPRRGAAPAAPRPGAAGVKAVEELLTAFDGDVRSALRHRLIAGDLAEAGHTYLAGGPAVTPLGAAVVARGVAGVLPWSRRDELTAFADFWRVRHGLAFAAAATVELAGFHLGSSPSDSAITRAVPDADANGFAARTAIRMAYQLRRAVVAAPPGEYAAAVTALGAARGPSLSQQALVSVIAPDETVWADEICGGLVAMGGREALKGLLLTVVSADPLASRLAGQLSPWAVLAEKERIYTFTATLGPAAAPALTAHDWAAVAGKLGTSASNGWDEIDLFLRGPDELTLPRVAAWRPSHHYDVADWGAELLARYGAQAVPPLADVARRAPAAAARLLAPAAGPEIAMLMAGWLARVRSVRPVALAWFARHTAVAARALVPVAVGRAGQARADAEGALRVLAAAGYGGEVRAAAGEFGPEAAASVEEILAVDPLTVLPVPVPALPDWANPAVMPPIRLTGDRGLLPVESVRHVLTMLALSRTGTPYPGLAVVTAECEAADLAESAWALFTEWREAGHPAKQNWALDALGLLGDDETVRRLAPVIRAWPGEGGHTRAVAGLDVLAAIGTDVALMYLHGIAQKVKFRALRERAGEKIAELAAELGLTAEELADRLVPDLGLDATGSLVLDYGRRTFTVGFDEQLKPFVADTTGKRLKALPRPGAQDDPVLAPEAYQRFTALKKDVRAIAADQVRRLEQAMVTRRRWTGATFRQFLTGHPLLRHLVRRLVWVRLDAAGRPGGGLRLAEDGSLADVTDETVTLGGTEPVGIAHPLDLGDDLAAWSELFADYEITQPFPQLGRGVEPLTAERAAGFVGRTAPSTALLGLERRGWRRGSPQDGGVQGWFERDVPGGLHLVLAITPGIAVGAIDVLGDQTVESIHVAPAGEYHGFRRDQDDRIRELDPITAAEALRDLTEVLA